MLDLELDGDVRDAEPRQLDRIRSSTSGWEPARHDGVAAHRHHAAGHGPDVEIVHRGDAGNAEHPALHFGHGDVAGNPFQQDVGALPHQPPGPTG